MLRRSTSYWLTLTRTTRRSDSGGIFPPKFFSLCLKNLAVTHVGVRVQNVGRDLPGQQEGQVNMGDADEERRLQGTGAGSRSIKATMSRKASGPQYA